LKLTAAGVIETAAMVKSASASAMLEAAAATAMKSAKASAATVEATTSTATVEATKSTATAAVEAATAKSTAGICRHYERCAKPQRENHIYKTSLQFKYSLENAVCLHRGLSLE
jgi:hypothetical protein